MNISNVRDRASTRSYRHEVRTETTAWYVLLLKEKPAFMKEA